MNLAGFRREDEFAWGRLGKWWQRGGMGSYLWGKDRKWKKVIELEEEDWGNVTGVLSGEWVRYTGDLAGKEKTGRHLHLRKIVPGLGWAFRDPEDCTMNVTGNEGRVMLRIEEKASLEMEVEEEEDTVEEESELGIIIRTGVNRAMALVREVAATVMVQDESTGGDGWEMRVYGVHWPRAGVLLMTTTSEKFAGIFGLPHLSLGRGHFLTSQRLLSAAIEKTLEGMEKAVWIDTSNLWTASPGAKADATRPVPHCEFVVYVQLHPLESAFVDRQPNVQKAVKETERELRCLYGASFLRTPGLQMSTAIFSPDCGFILESKGLPEFFPTDGQHLICKEQEGP